MRAIAAMAKNRVIGRGGDIPWRIPDEFRWFRRKTMGSYLVMGRRTFESLPRPLDGRVTVVLTRDPERLRASDPRYAGAIVGEAALAPAEFAPGRAEVRLVGDLERLEAAGLTRNAWLCGGAELYAQFLDRCFELFLSVIDHEVEGDAFFPPFEHLFDLAGVELEAPEFRVLRYVRKSP